MTQNDSNSQTLPLRGRLAPSPTGYMHLGNVWSFLMAWLSVRQKGGTLVLRMEDIDPDRAKSHYAEAFMRDLAWLGLYWDEGPDMGGPHAPYTQSQRREYYTDALDFLTREGHTYPCFCTRKELRAMAGAPHLGEATVYAGICRNLTPLEREQRLAKGHKPCIRLRCSDEIMPFMDRRCGPQSISLKECGGDFAIRRSDGVFAYQLAVVLDDMHMRITDIVRGDDLLHCTPRQLFLQRLLAPFVGGIQKTPSYLHVPLLLDEEGERFAKRHASLTIHSLREAGIPASYICGYIAYLAGFISEYEPMCAEELVPFFNPLHLSKGALSLKHAPAQILYDLAHKKIAEPRLWKQAILYDIVF